MRGSLRDVRRRVERLAGRVGNGCGACQEDEAKIRYHWRDTRPEPTQSLDDELADLPHVTTCDVCGRTYPLQYQVVSWMS